MNYQFFLFYIIFIFQEFSKYDSHKYKFELSYIYFIKSLYFNFILKLFLNLKSFNVTNYDY